MGHNLNLLHDGVNAGAPTGATGYYLGTAGWAPIMGAGYYQPLSQVRCVYGMCSIVTVPAHLSRSQLSAPHPGSIPLAWHCQWHDVLVTLSRLWSLVHLLPLQWSKGEYAYAGNTQDDFAVAQLNGLPLRADDFGDTLAAASPLTGGTPSPSGTTTFTVQGVIHTAGDVDVLSLSATPGPVTVAVNPAGRSPNLDAQVTLQAADGTVLASANPTSTLDASLSFTIVTPGTYFVSVQGVGLGDPLVTGYTNYGSLGNYVLTVTATTGVPPTLVATATPTSGTYPLTVTFSTAGSVDADGTIVSFVWNFGDGVSGVTGTAPIYTYTSFGTYNAVVVATDSSGLTASHTLTIVVSSLPPTAVATASTTSGVFPFTVTFSASGSVDPDGTIASYSWDFGDGTTGTGVTASRTYTGAVAKTFSVTVRTTDDSGASTTSSPLSIVGSVNKAPTAVATASATSGIFPFTVTFSASRSVDIDGTIASYLWTFGDGTTGTGVTASRTYTGTVPKTFSVTVRTTDDKGASTTSSPLSIVGTLSARVSSLTMSATLSGNKRSANANALVTVVTASGALPSATVTGTWSGAVSGTVTGTTSTSGTVSFKSPSSNTKGATFTFTVTGVTKTGYTYLPATNTVTSRSIVSPV